VCKQVQVNIYGLKYLYHLKRETYSFECRTDWES